MELTIEQSLQRGMAAQKDGKLEVEDSDDKQEVIRNFTREKEPKYQLDQFFLDFLGKTLHVQKTQYSKCFNLLS